MKTKKPVFSHRQKYTTILGKTVDVLKDTYPLIDGSDIIGAYAICRTFTDARIMANNVIGQMFEESKNADDILAIDFCEYPFQSDVMKQNSQKIKNSLTKFHNISIFATDGSESKEIAKFISRKVNKGQNFFELNIMSIEPAMQKNLLFGDVGDEKNGLLHSLGDSILVLSAVENLTTEVQLKLCEFLSNNPIKIITLFNQTPDEILRSKRLSIELFYQLNMVYLFLPDLKTRKGDISLYINSLASYHTKKMKKDIKFSLSAYQHLVLYDWYGNYIEMFHTIQSLILSCDSNTIEIHDLPLHIKNSHEKNISKSSSPIKYSTLSDALNHAEHQTISLAMEKNNHNISKAAQDLGVSRQNLQYRLKKLGI